MSALFFRAHYDVCCYSLCQISRSFQSLRGSNKNSSFKLLLRVLAPVEEDGTNCKIMTTSMRDRLSRRLCPEGKSIKQQKSYKLNVQSGTLKGRC